MNKNHEIISEMKEVFYKALESVKNIVTKVMEIILERKERKKHNYNWYVPKNVIKNHQVMNRKPLVANIRSNL